MVAERIPHVPYALFPRWIRRGLWLIVVSVLFGWIGYEIGGHTAIRLLHEGRFDSLLSGSSFLNPQKPLDYYLRLGDEVIHSVLLYVLLAVCSVCCLRAMWVSPGKYSRLILGFAVVVFASIYLLNPTKRIVSSHGLLHTGFVYQILNGFVPPNNPMLASEPLFYPWGYHFLVAGLCRILQISPAWSFALMNLLSLVLCIFLLVRISRCLIRDPDSQVLSVWAGLFASTIMTKMILVYLSDVTGFLLEWRAIPAGQKFSNVNGVPVGLVFFLLMMLALIRLAQNHKSHRYAAVLFLAAGGCGFVYPLLFPAVCASCGLVALFSGFWPAKPLRDTIFALLRILLPLGLAVALLIPYFRTIAGSNSESQIRFFQFEWMLLNGFTVIVVLAPMVLLIALEWNALRSRWNSQAAFVLLGIILACLGCYVGIHMHHAAEYKALIPVGIGAGVFGGLALARLRNRLSPGAFLLLLMVFLLPSLLEWVPAAVSHSWGRTPIFYERGKTLTFWVPEQDRLYRWIREETPINSVFIDNSLDIPAMGQRSLYIGWDGRSDRNYLQSGYAIHMDDWLGSQSGYERQMIDRRNRIVQAVYSSNEPLSQYDLAELRRFDPLFIVIRDPGLMPRFTGDDFQAVFDDSSNRIRVVRLRGR